MPRVKPVQIKACADLHDEVVIDCLPDAATLEDVVRIMTRPIPWAPDLPLGADGWVGKFFRKD